MKYPYHLYLRQGRWMPTHGESRQSRRILVVDDDPAIGILVSLCANDLGDRKVTSVQSAREGLVALRTRAYDLILLDLGLADMGRGQALGSFIRQAEATPVVVITADNRVDTAVLCIKAGAFDFLEKPLSPARLFALFSRVDNEVEMDILKGHFGSGSEDPTFPGIVTRSPIVGGLLQSVDRFAPSRFPVLILGESGTGKELFARAIHARSGRGGAFVPVNMAGVEGSLFSDMLFGHARGAFTGADQMRQGLVKKATAGTLFMDEIGDIETENQAKLLDFLQDGEYYPLGSDRSEAGDCRIVVATNVDLYRAVQEGKFRADLYYRLMVHAITLPPLRNRREDIPILAEHFLIKAAQEFGRPYSPPGKAFLIMLQAYDFPGNVRELSALVYGALGASSSNKPSLSYLKDYLNKARARRTLQTIPACEEKGEGSDEPFPTLAELEERHIREALRRSGGNQTEAAALVGLSQATISRRIQQLSIQIE